MSETYATYRVWDGCKAPINLEYSGRLIGQIARESTIDREALLRIAEDLDYEGMDGWADTVNVGDYARRIRKALGVTDA